RLAQPARSRQLPPGRSGGCPQQSGAPLSGDRRARLPGASRQALTPVRSPLRFCACAPASPAGRCAPAVPRFAALLLLASAACHRYPDDTPGDAYRSLLSAVQRDEDERVMALLSEKSRTALTARAEELTRLSGGSLRPTPAELLMADPKPPAAGQI